MFITFGHLYFGGLTAFYSVMSFRKCSVPCTLYMKSWNVCYCCWKQHDVLRKINTCNLQCLIPLDTYTLEVNSMFRSIYSLILSENLKKIECLLFLLKKKHDVFCIRLTTAIFNVKYRWTLILWRMNSRVFCDVLPEMFHSIKSLDQGEKWK